MYEMKLTQGTFVLGRGSFHNVFILARENRISDPCAQSVARYLRSAILMRTEMRLREQCAWLMHREFRMANRVIIH
jgi:hypothetical protein